MASDDSSCVHIPLDRAVTAARDLNELVVSLDRIMSRIASDTNDPVILAQYVADQRVIYRIAWVRSEIFDALEKVVGVRRADEIAEEGHESSYPNRSPL